uniref:omega-amidase n=1 Tax=Strigamia maritima TaxID=126957 RepID=T1J3N0_STRMM
MAASKLRLGLIQLGVGGNKSENLYRASKFIGEAVSNGAKVISLPECFNSPYGNNFFPTYAEQIPGETTQQLSYLAKEHQIYLIGGPAHWELLSRARALDNQLYVATVSPARDEQASYVAWGHSLVVNPWGTVIGTLDHSEGVLYADLDLGYVDEIRSQIPVLSGQQKSLYEKV